ncbi:hypothetical protein I7I50_12202 [Histoplasma capsulatum G186AR]|uniref:Uncharacterized protein n=1 Tax=Ajellomyces capsulatus TaxID=5037 RepID=A0A8H8CSX6_AJECA|nr:hypothetical protein I7I52_11486 [Histoplasma capsulatum]QSS70543.1 hypothetical protein I7I50_12202 [Histoplasma capsulatum G186AR]
MTSCRIFCHLPCRLNHNSKIHPSLRFLLYRTIFHLSFYPIFYLLGGWLHTERRPLVNSTLFSPL